MIKIPDPVPAYSAYLFLIPSLFIGMAFTFFFAGFYVIRLALNSDKQGAKQQ
jgi:hypothetical protein